MFADHQRPTAVYRALARGRGSDFARRYAAAHGEDAAPRAAAPPDPSEAPTRVREPGMPSFPQHRDR
jgi:hypothetical protein